MNGSLTVTDLLAISPILILLLGTLTLLMLESFLSELMRKISAPLTIAFLLLALVAAWVSPISHNPLLTDWLRFDSLATFFTTFFLLTGIGSTLLAASFFNVNRPETTFGEYYFLLLAATVGLILIGMSADFLTLFIGLETLSVALYILCGYMKKWSLSHEAAMKYFLLGALAAALLLYGIAFVYGAIGTTNFADLLPGYQKLGAGIPETLFFTGIAFITVGIAFKAAIVPFHSWAPDVYSGSPTPVTAFMSVGTKIGAFAALSIVFLLFLPRFHPLWNEGIVLLAYPTMVFANIVAIRQTQLRRFFAYSGISHSGFLLFAFAAGTPEVIPSVLFYLTVYALATFGAFAVISLLDKDSGGATISDCTGLFHRSPLLASLLILSLLTLAGLPPTVGFIAKFFLFKIAFEAGYYGLVVVGLLMTILSIFYYTRIAAVMFAQPSELSVTPQRSWAGITLGVVTAVAIVSLSLFPSLL